MAKKCLESGLGCITHTKSPKFAKIGSTKHAPVINHREAPSKIKERNLMGVSPLKQQFEPTESNPIRQHHRMAGGE